MKPHRQVAGALLAIAALLMFISLAGAAAGGKAAPFTSSTPPSLPSNTPTPTNTLMPTATPTNPPLPINPSGGPISTPLSPTNTPTATGTPTNCTDGYEPDNDATSAGWFPPGLGSEHHSFCRSTEQPNDDHDWVKFTGKGGSTFEIGTSNLGISADTVITLYNVNLVVVASDDDSGGGRASYIHYQMPAGSILYLEVVNKSGQGGFGPDYAYDLYVYSTCPTPAPTNTVYPTSTPYPTSTFHAGMRSSAPNPPCTPPTITPLSTYTPQSTYTPVSTTTPVFTGTATATSTPGGPTATSTAVITSTPTQTPCPYYWFNDSSLPGPRIGAAVAANASTIWEAGGDDGSASHISNAAASYSGSGSWQPLPAMPISTTDAVAASDGARFYVFGGKGANGMPTTNLQIYNPISNTWTMGAPLLVPVYGATAVYAASGIYLFGGCNDAACSSPLATTQVYAPIENTWLIVANVPSGSAYAAAAFDGIKSIFFAGGLDNSGHPSNRLMRYDFMDNRWDTRGFTPLPNIWWGMAGAEFNHNFVIYGGIIDGVTVTNRTLSYDPNANSWTELAPLNQATFKMAGAALSGSLYIVGGSTGGSSGTSRVERYSLQCGGLPTPTTTPLVTNTPLPSATPTDCPNPFVDVSGNIFYTAIHYLTCRGVINGTDASHYSPAATATRGQFAKIVVLGFGLQLYTPTGGTQDFTDVAPNYFAYVYIETGLHNGILSGFDPASCTAAGAIPPCYLPNRPITRGQLTKLVVNAAHYQFYTPTSGQTFIDVPPANIFYVSIETAAHKGVIAGYPDQTFRPNNNIRRDEMAQIVYKGVITP